MELVDFLIRNQLIIFSFILFAISGTAALLNIQYGKDISTGVISKRWLPQVAGLALLPPVLLGGGLSLTNFDPIPKTSFFVLPEPLCSKPANRKLLVFIHGWNGDSKNTWRNFPSLACNDSRFSDVDILVVNYPTYMTRTNAHIAELADWLNKELDVVGQTKRYEKMAIVAHSLGGLIAREMVINRHLANKQNNFGLLISVASPYEGADIARLGEALNISWPLAEEARSGSSFLVTLGTHWTHLTPRPATHCYSSPSDTVVHSSSALANCDGRTNHPYNWGHQDLVKPDTINDHRYALPMYEIEQFMASPRKNI